MPLQSNGQSYSTRGHFSHRTVTRLSVGVHTRARLTTRVAPRPYPTAADIAYRMDTIAPNDPWYNHLGDDLFYRDFIYQARIQSARRMSQRVSLFPGRDQILERLMVEGTFDREEQGFRNDAEENAIHHATAMCQRLLVRIEDLEGSVRVSDRAGG